MYRKSGLFSSELAFGTLSGSLQHEFLGGTVGVVAIHTTFDFLGIMFDQEIRVLEIVAFGAKSLVGDIGPVLVGGMAIETILQHVV